MFRSFRLFEVKTVGLRVCSELPGSDNGKLEQDYWKHSKGPNSFEVSVNPNFSEQPFLFD